MEYRIYTKQDAQVSAWSGGETMQLVIQPADGDYGERQFTYRLSSATVELEESTFTPLPGFKRWLLPLEGELDLTHEHDGQVDQLHLGEFQAHWFLGAWETKSVGRCRDFNLIYEENLEAAMRPILAQHETTKVMDQEALLFAYKPLTVAIQHNGEARDIKLDTFSTLWLAKGQELDLTITGQGDTQAVYAWLA